MTGGWFGGSGTASNRISPTRYGHRVEPSHPVDPLAEQTPAIPQARRSTDPAPGDRSVTDPSTADPSIAERSTADPANRETAAGDQAADPASVGDQHATGPASAGDQHATGPGSGAASDPGVAGGEPVARGGDAGTPAAKPLPRVWNVRSVLLLILAVVMGLGAVAIVGGYFLYSKATEPDRSTPSLVSRRYIDAVYNDRDRRVAGRFTCGNPDDVTGGEQLLDEITAKEQAHNVQININIENVREQITGNEATVTARLRLNTVVNGRTQEQLQSWRYTLAKRSGGWRVCDAARTG